MVPWLSDEHLGLKFGKRSATGCEGSEEIHVCGSALFLRARLLGIETAARRIRSVTL